MELKSILVKSDGAWRKSATSIALSAIGAITSEIILGGFLESQMWNQAAGRVGIVAIALFVIHRFALESLYAYKPRLKDLVTLTSVLLGSVTLIALGRLICLSIHAYAKSVAGPSLNFIAEEIGVAGLYYIIPFASSGILIQALMGIEFALVFTMGLGLITGIYFPEDLTISALVISSTFIGSLGMLKVRSRQAYIKAGANVTAVTLLFVLAKLIFTESFDALHLSIGVITATIGGIVTTFVISGIAPAIERLGGYVTDISLLEIATLDHPLLKQLSIQAPGTWNHSMVMGMMVESAAQAINANPVLSRVACYYHDVGKVKNPLYFIENQVRGENRHDKLSPSMSALIIKSHVKDGIKMAQESGLPQAIIDMIPQHHGTSLIEYFYDKALTEAEENGTGETINENSYRYPGPKPQTKEAGIIMLADGIEAASRTLPDPSMDRIQGLVNKMINKVFSSGELEECELTLRELHEIARCFTRVLTGIYHSRIAYPEGAHEESKDEPVTTEEQADSKPTVIEPEQPHKAESKKEDLKRLGIEN